MNRGIDITGQSNGLCHDHCQVLPCLYCQLEEPHLTSKSVEQQARIKELEDAIRSHRNKQGHEVCWENDLELWALLKDGKVDQLLPSRCEFLQKCQEYYDTRGKRS